MTTSITVYIGFKNYFKGLNFNGLKKLYGGLEVREKNQKEGKKWDN